MRTLDSVLPRLGVACELELPGGELRRFGAGAPEFRLILRNGRLLRTRLSEFALARAYVEGDVDVEVTGDVLALFRIRDQLGYGTPLRQAVRLGAELLLAVPQLANHKAIQHHYTAGDELYLTFLDRRYHFYSHCLFHSDDETLEEAAEHKLEAMWDALGLRPGMRLLDIGGGWGGVAAYCGARGVHVTSLTLTEQSAAFIRHRIREHDLTAEVVVQDLLDHRPREPYDHAVIFGVIEHIPTYRRFCARVWDALVPGGRLYLDASATKLKYAGSAVTRHYTWRGPHSCLALQDMTAELLFHGFDIVRVRRETRDYELTMRHWADRFDAARDEVVTRWGEPLYRAFRVFLWGGTHAFQTDRLQAYSVVAERRSDPGPRPRLPLRAAQFMLSLR